MHSPLGPLMMGAAPRRRLGGGGGRWLGRILGTLAVVFLALLLIGFGVQQQADHQVVSPASHSSHQ